MAKQSERYIFNIDAFIKIRKDKKLSRKAMAELLRKKERTIKAWETGEGLPSTATIESIAKLLSVPANSIGVNYLECLNTINKERVDIHQKAYEMIRSVLSEDNEQRFGYESIQILLNSLRATDNEDMQKLLNNPKLDIYNEYLMNLAKEELLVNLL